MKKYIKYEELSHDLRKEIQLYYDKERVKDKDLSLEDAMVKWFDENFEEWIIAHYFTGPEHNKRKNVRFEIEIPVKIVETLIESSADETEVVNMIGSIINISRGGLYFRSEEPIENSSIIKVEIDFSLIDKKLKGIEALAMVVRVDKLDDGDYGIGVIFSSIYGDHKNNLDIFIFKNLAYHVYKERSNLSGES